MTTRSNRLLAFLLIVLALAPTRARSDAETDALWLSRICVHEANWRGGEPDVNDCGAIMQVVTNRHPDRDFRRALASTSPRFHGGTSDRAWARELRLGTSRSPEHWPEGWPAFSVYRDDFERVYERSLAFMRGDVAPPCEGSPRNWLSRVHPRDRAVAHRHVEVLRDWREVECGTTINAFYEPVPSS